MAGYFHSLAAHGALPGPRIRPAAVPYGSPGLLPAPEPSTATPEVDAVAAPHDTRTAIHEPPSSERVDATRRSHAPAPSSSPAVPEIAAASALTDEASRTESSRPLSSTRSTSPVVDRLETRASIDPPARIAAPDRAPGAQAVQSVARAARPVTAAPSASAPQPRESSAPRRDEPPDVHIHIGRIELTAVAPSAPPRRSAQPGTKAMPLDEYLRRRDRKAR